MTNTSLFSIQTELVNVFRGHYVDHIKAVLADNYECSSVDVDGNNALHLVCMPKTLQKHSGLVIRLVVAKGVSVHARNNFGFTPLMLASLLLPSDLVRVVLEGIPGTESLGESLHEALLLAAIYNRPDVVSALIGAGAKITEPSSHEEQSLRQLHLERHKRLLQQIDTLLGVFPEFDRELALQKDLDGSDLVRLASSTDGKTKQYVALNPNTPSETLVRLAPEFPRAFYKNPAFDWLLLEKPDLLFEIEKGVLKHILSLSDCSASIIQWAARNGSDSEKLVVVRRLDAENSLLQIVAAGKPCKAATIAIARNHESTVDQLERICGQDEAADRLLASHPNASESLLAKLSESGDDLVRKYVFSHKNTSQTTRQSLSDGHVRVHRLQ